MESGLSATADKFGPVVSIPIIRATLLGPILSILPSLMHLSSRVISAAAGACGRTVCPSPQNRVQSDPSLLQNQGRLYRWHRPSHFVQMSPHEEEI